MPKMHFSNFASNFASILTLSTFINTFFRNVSIIRPAQRPIHDLYEYKYCFEIFLLKCLYYETGTSGTSETL